jgi:hypothetical protein
MCFIPMSTWLLDGLHVEQDMCFIPVSTWLLDGLHAEQDATAGWHATM